MKNDSFITDKFIIILLAMASILINCRSRSAHYVKHLPERFDPCLVKEALIRHLEEEVIPFWTSTNLCDKKFGGFLPWLNADLKRTRNTNKHLIVHLRFLYIHALAEAISYPGIDIKQIHFQYNKQMKFLRQKFRDSNDKEWYHVITREGTPIDTQRQMLDQVYVIYIMSEIFQLIRDSTALELAEKTFQLVDKKGHDEKFGGYIEYAMLSDSEKVNLEKSVGTNMHIALALSKLVRFSSNEIYRERLEELYNILTTHIIIHKSGNAYMMFKPDWQEPLISNDSGKQTLYGHNAELVWYMLEVAEALGRDSKEIQHWLDDLTRGVINNGIGRSGEIYLWGPLVGRPSDLYEIRWWPQCEVMIMLIRMYLLTGNEEYWWLFKTVTKFTFDNMVPDNSGAWLGGINLRSGQRYDRGGWALKSGFHVTRMLLECNRGLGKLVKFLSP